MTSKDDEVSKQDAIAEMVSKAEPGEVFVLSDFAGAGSTDVVRKSVPIHRDGAHAVARFDELSGLGREHGSLGHDQSTNGGAGVQEPDRDGGARPVGLDDARVHIHDAVRLLQLREPDDDLRSCRVRPVRHWGEQLLLQPVREVEGRCRDSVFERQRDGCYGTHRWIGWQGWVLYSEVIRSQS